MEFNLKMEFDLEHVTHNRRLLNRMVSIFASPRGFTALQGASLVLGEPHPDQPGKSACMLTGHLESEQRMVNGLVIWPSNIRAGAFDAIPMGRLSAYDRLTGSHPLRNSTWRLTTTVNAALALTLINLITLCCITQGV